MCYHWHVMQCPFPNTYVWLIVHELNFYISAQKKSNKHKRCEILGISKENLLHPIQQCVLLLGNSKKGTVQCLVPKHHLTVFLVVKYKYFQYIYRYICKWLIHILVPSMKRMIFGQDKNVLLTPLHYKICTSETADTNSKYSLLFLFLVKCYDYEN